MPSEPTLTDLVPPGAAASDPDALYEVFATWAQEQGRPLYPHQEDAFLHLLDGSNVVLATPTGSGKSQVATAALFAALAADRVAFYTAPIKALVSEKFFDLCRTFGAENVGMLTGDAAVNADAPIVVCTAEILANIALREGAGADVGMVVMDEFHYYAEPDRGWAWQVPLLVLPQAQFLLMSATLGDISGITEDLSARTGRETASVTGTERPVPLHFADGLVMTHITETVADLLLERRAPAYVVHFTQKEALERAQALLSTPLLSKEEKEAVREKIGAFRFTAGFGRTLSKLVRHGVGVHHAGMLPRYRRLVEQLAQDGLLKVICGTDTLGVGINVPIRTVLFTGLAKYDGTRSRILRAREFHQIAGRAGRAGYDTEGYVAVQAPEHSIENFKAVEKAGDDPKKLRKVQRRKPPEGFISWTEETYAKLVSAPPEPLVSRMRVDHSIILNTVARAGDPVTNLARLLRDNHEEPRAQARLQRKAIALGRSMLDSGILVRADPPGPGGRTVDLAPGVAENFALNQPLAPFALAALDLFDREDPAYALDVVSVVEAVLDDPMPVLVAQRYRAKGEAVARMKADGIEYDERMALLDDVTWPRPHAELLEGTLAIYRQTQPWVREDALSPKSVVRDMWERAMSFTEFVGFYQLARSEGVLLRYLTDCYRTLRQTLPSSALTEQLEDVVHWLGETIRQTDSSLLEEWEALTDPDLVAAAVAREAAGEAAVPTRPITSNERAFRVMVRNAAWRRVELVADDAWEALGELEAQVAALPEAALEPLMSRQDWDEAIEGYYDEHGSVVLDADARGPLRLAVEPLPGERSAITDGRPGRVWRVVQTLTDPAGHLDWVIEAECDLDASDLVGEPVLLATAMRRL
ncbi:DEAD/DEAH box helicase [Ornithinimicrobium cerasi]|uniref:Helicase conserved C-terminal domain-containing protein n=1 Tax=Ornithinimicrobium cerasi TaxID=2248773 RepID=A0A285VSL1_9MICO|nr:DEAD/DEAH box helicase [Ornithinimicrobium cerasi]SOC57039.1 Helicase conserved C-terminal domain-containing protein [Ornithinimicrobium cerasi]